MLTCTLSAMPNAVLHMAFVCSKRKASGDTLDTPSNHSLLRASGSDELAPSQLPSKDFMLIRECPTVVSDGKTYYSVRICGQERTDGTWEGWIEFQPPGARSMLRT